MFDLQKFIFCADHGIEADREGFAKYTHNFEEVILWGAGSLGRAVATALFKNNCKVTRIWDIKADLVEPLYNLPIEQPMAKEYDRERTLIIFCIGNVLTRANIQNGLKENDYFHVIDGVTVRQALWCPLAINKKFDGSVCAVNEICAACGCSRLDNLVKKMKSGRDLDDTIFYSSLHFLVNTKCNLKCKYCYEYLQSYPKNLKYNVPYDSISRDIDITFNAIDAIATVFIVGGETFLHPDIGKIAKKILAKENFGLLVIPTNGLAIMDKKSLEGLQDSRVRLAFSNYLGQLTPEQEDRMQRNFETAVSMGINAHLQNSLPSWNIPGTFEYKNSPELAVHERSICPYICNWVYDGKMFICSFSITMHNLFNLSKDDYINLLETTNISRLRSEIIHLQKKSYIPSCQHCDWNTPRLTDRAGEQGFDSRYSLENYQDLLRHSN